MGYMLKITPKNEVNAPNGFEGVCEHTYIQTDKQKNKQTDGPPVL